MSKKYTKEKRLQILENSTVNNLLYTDTHFHYSSMIQISKKNIEEQTSEEWLEKKSIENLLNSCNFQGMDIGTNCDDLELRYRALEKYTNIHLSAGIGPWATDREESIQEQNTILRNNINKYPVSAIGEIGLDNYWHYGTVKLQEELFNTQLDLAEELDLPIIIHSRDADSQMIDILKNREIKKGGIFHCFSSNIELAKVALEKGLLISFAGTITYNKNQELRDTLAIVPLNRLLLETDSPYLPPEPYRGKHNSPSLIPLVYLKASEINKCSIELISKAVSMNFLNLLGNPKRLEK
ncbi:MAG: TatD family hydrolase [Spirochaetaceae bacterium]|nr:TatD family hydrolase [Spirochaetaceae bacterium]